LSGVAAPTGVIPITRLRLTIARRRIAHRRAIVRRHQVIGHRVSLRRARCHQAGLRLMPRSSGSQTRAGYARAARPAPWHRSEPWRRGAGVRQRLDRHRNQARELGPRLEPAQSVLGLRRKWLGAVPQQAWLATSPTRVPLPPSTNPQRLPHGRRARRTPAPRYRALLPACRHDRVLDVRPLRPEPTATWAAALARAISATAARPVVAMRVARAVVAPVVANEAYAHFHLLTRALQIPQAFFPNQGYAMVPRRY